MNLVSPDKVEGCKCKEVNLDNIDSILEIALEMAEIMITKRGIGLAAPQVGIYKRFFVMKNFRGNGYVTIINPEIIKVSDKIGTFNEGCLTYPWNYRVNVKRPKQIKASWISDNGDWISMKLTGRESQCFLHEFDHLDGICIRNKD